MTGQKLMLLGVLTLIGGTAFESEAQAGPFRRRARNANVEANCACSGGMYTTNATVHGGVPLAMPVPGTGVVVPAGNVVNPTRIPASGAVVPAAGVVPSESYYFDPSTGTYYPRSSINNRDFVPGVIQGSTGTNYYPAGTPANYAGRRIGRLFRR